MDKEGGQSVTMTMVMVMMMMMVMNFYSTVVEKWENNWGKRNSIPSTEYSLLLQAIVQYSTVPVNLRCDCPRMSTTFNG